MTASEAEPMPPATVAIASMAHGGEGFGRLPDGRAAFVDGALPGELAPVAAPPKGRFVRLPLAALPTPPSPDRRPAPCPHFGAWPERGLAPRLHCGGCHWQHADYGAQLRYKRQILEDCLRRIGGLERPPVEAVIGMDEPWGYRNHLRLRWLGPGEGAGLVALDGRSLVAVRDCPIAHPLVLELLEGLELELEPGTELGLRAGLATGDQMIVLHSAAEDLDSIDVERAVSVAVVDPETGATHAAAGRPYLVEGLGGRHFMVPAAGFFQVNTAMAEVLVAQVSARLPDRGERLIDLYSGVGTFAVLLAERFRETVAVESNAAAVAAAVENGAGLDDRLTLIEAPAAEGLAWALGEGSGRADDCIVVDPPRAGLDAETLALLARAAAGTMIYVSCDPATLARDCRRLLEAGWQLESCQGLDMFPQTYHIESVNRFRRPQALGSPGPS